MSLALQPTRSLPSGRSPQHVGCLAARRQVQGRRAQSVRVKRLQRPPGAEWLEFGGQLGVKLTRLPPKWVSRSGHEYEIWWTRRDSNP
jgi:hypothetical protein